MGSQHRIGALVLAAGQSRRMGTPKALLPIAGEPMLRRILRTLRDAREIDPIIVVTGQPQAEISVLIEESRAIPVQNEHFSTGEMVSSIKAGAPEFRGAVDAFFIMLVDQPMIQPQTLTTMSSLWRARRPTVLLPTHSTKRGHPILIAAGAITELLALPVEATLKTFTSRHRSSTLEIDVDDPAILHDIDTPADYARLVEEHEVRSCTDRMVQPA